MSWSLALPKGDTSPDLTTIRLPAEGVVHLVQTIGLKALGIVHERRPEVHTELGRVGTSQ